MRSLQNALSIKNRRSLHSLLILILTILCISSVIHSGNCERAGLESDVLLLTASDDGKLERSLRIDQETINLAAVLTESNIGEYSIGEFETLVSSVDVIFVNRFLPTDLQKLRILTSYINGTDSDKGMVMFGLMEGDINAAQIEIINPILPVNLTNYINSTEDISNINYEISVKQESGIPEESQILVDTIQWNSFPSVDRRTKLIARDQANIIVSTVPEVTGDDKYTILADWNASASAGRVIFFACEIIDKNIAVPLWPYFNYFVYTCNFHVHPDYVSNSIESFQDWPHSPIPHTLELIGWFTMIGVLWFITFYGFYRVKKVSRPWQQLQDEDDVRNGRKRRSETSGDETDKTTNNIEERKDKGDEDL